MAPVRTFIRWLKGKSSKDEHQTKIARLRKLPPIPPNGYEYGFRISEASDNSAANETHVYEEIPYEEIPAPLRHQDGAKQPTGTITDAMQQLDFSGAKTVGPYLVVPIRKGDVVPEQLNEEEYRSLYSMFPEWAKHQLKDASRKRQGLAISRGYSVDPPAQPKPANTTSQSSQSSQNSSTRRHSNSEKRTVVITTESPSILEKSHDSGHGSDDSDSDGYLRSRCTDDGNCRNHHGENRRSIVSNSDSLSDLEVFADEVIDDDFEFFILETNNDTHNNTSLATTDISLTTVSSLETTLPSNRQTVDRRSKRHSQPEKPSPQPANPSAKYHVAAEALIDQLYQSSQRSKHTTKPQVPPRQNNKKSDKSTGLSSTLSRDDSTIHGTMTSSHSSMTSSNRMSCRISDFQLDNRYHRRSMDFRSKSRHSSTSSSGVDSDYSGSVYGPSRGSRGGLDHNPQNRFLGDMMRMNYDRQLMMPHL